MFVKLDADSSGHLCKTELVQARRVMLFDRYNVSEAVRKIDSSSVDGDNDGMVDEQEWHTFIGSLYELLGRTQFIAVLQGWTQGADGKPQLAPSQPSESRSKTNPPRPEPKKTWGAPAASKAPEPKGWGVASRPQAKAKGGAGMKPKVLAEGGAEMQPKVPAEGPALEEEAAVKIQAQLRGKIARKESLEKEKAVKEKAIKKTPKEMDEQKVTTVAEVWDMLTTDRNFRGVVLGLEICDILDLYMDCKESGLAMELAQSVPMHFATKLPPENVTTEEVLHLCMKLLNRKEAKVEGDMSEYEARVELDPIKEELREIGDRRGNTQHQEMINLRIWRQLIPILSSLLRIDVDLVTSHWAWTRGGRFELPPALAAHIMASCKRKGQRPDGADLDGPEIGDAADGLWASLAIDEDDAGDGDEDDAEDLSVLRKKFSLNDFMVLAHNGGIVDSKGKAGMTTAALQQFFQKLLQNMPELLKVRPQKPKRERPKLRGGERGLVGRAEFEVMFEELAKAGPFPKLFKSPLHMAVRLTKAAQEKPPAASAKAKAVAKAAR